MGMRFAAASLLLVVSCSNSDSTASSSGTVTQSVGPEGAVIEVSGAKVTIPKGALADTKQITIRESTEKAPDGYTVLSKMFRCEPAGTDFAQPVTMEMPFNDDGKPSRLFWTTGSDPAFKDVGGEKRGNVMVATVMHFSGGFVGHTP
jgi:hypothetical protein